MDVLLYKEAIEQELMLLDQILATMDKMAKTSICRELRSQVTKLRNLKQNQANTVTDILSRGADR